MKYLQYILFALIGITCLMCTRKHKCCDDNKKCGHKEESTITVDNSQSIEDSTTVIASEPIKIDSLLTLTKGACFGKCPVYNLLITQTGEIYLENKMFMDKIGKFKGQLSISELNKVHSTITNVNYFEFEHYYPTNQKYFISDLPNTNTAVYIDSKAHKIFNNNSAPNSLLDFEKFIVNLVLDHASLTPED